MRRWVLSKRDRRRLLRELRDAYPAFSAEDYERIEVVVDNDVELYLFDGIPAFVRSRGRDGRLIPHLVFLLRRGYDWLPAIIVDEGAVKPISRGADLMRPGVAEIRGDFRGGDILAVVEPSRGLPLAVHEALYGSDEVRAMERGRISKTLHHVGDRLWRLGEKV